MCGQRGVADGTCGAVDTRDSIADWAGGVADTRDSIADRRDGGADTCDSLADKGVGCCGDGVWRCHAAGLPYSRDAK